MVGAPGSGKSSWIKDNGIEKYTIAPDNLRLLVSAPEYSISGNMTISQKNDTQVWKLLDELLEKRMELGQFTVIDATHTREKYLKRYKALAEKYRYRTYIKKFDLPIEELLERNKNRDEYKRVPEEVIKLHFERLNSLVIPNSMEIIENINQINEFIRYPEVTKPIYFIGDVHGTLEPLNKFLDEHFSDDSEFVFLGDYIDRGDKNGEVLQRLINLSVKKNVTFLEGNHERWINHWASGENEKIRSREFTLRTMPQLEGVIDKKEARVFYRKLRTFYTCSLPNGDRVFACHGGVSTKYPHFISSEQLINGVGEYEQVPELYRNWDGNKNEYLVHGHRNNQDYPLVIEEYPNIFNLDGHVEFGGSLRVIKFNPSGVKEVFEYKNETFVPKVANKGGEDMVFTGITAIDEMRKSPYVRESVMGDISSFNFTNKAFIKRAWDNITIRARGLFINNKTNEIVARSYDKFFNYKERDETTDFALGKSLKFPVKVYQKYNGFLGIVGYDKSSDSVIYCSKSTIEGEFAKLNKEVLELLGVTEEKLKSVVSNGYSLVMEIIHPEKDPHIIEYSEPDAILLDIVKNDFEFQRVPYGEMVEVAKALGIKHKEEAQVGIVDWKHLQEWINGEAMETTEEGWVIEDSAGFMFKLKATFYSRWKMLRGLKDAVHKNGFRISDKAFDSESIKFLTWCKNNFTQEELRSKDIIELRNMFMNG